MGTPSIKRNLVSELANLSKLGQDVGDFIILKAQNPSYHQRKGQGEFRDVTWGTKK